MCSLFHWIIGGYHEINNKLLWVQRQVIHAVDWVHGDELKVNISFVFFFKDRTIWDTGAAPSPVAWCGWWSGEMAEGERSH